MCVACGGLWAGDPRWCLVQEEKLELERQEARSQGYPVERAEVRLGGGGPRAKEGL